MKEKQSCVKSSHTAPDDVVKGRVEGMVKDFEWNKENEGAEEAPESQFAQDVLNCATILQQKLAGLLKPEHLANVGMCISIPLSVHPFLKYCVKEQWTDESRSRFVDLLCLAFTGTINCEFKKHIALELNTRVLPITAEHRRVRTVTNIHLGDDPLETDDNKRFYIEIELGEAENPLWGTK